MENVVLFMNLANANHLRWSLAVFPVEFYRHHGTVAGALQLEIPMIEW